MVRIYKPWPYQDYATRRIVDNRVTLLSMADKPGYFAGNGLFLDMGLGKTVATLTAIDELMFDSLEIRKVLVIAPKRVAEETWTTEIETWEHLQHLKVSVCIGNERERIAALRTKAHIYTINRENVEWLVSYYQGAFPFDMLVIDELSSFKSPKSKRFKALRRVLPRVKRIVGLTGTPAPNGLLDLWSQVYLLDRGERLGETITAYREKYFTPGKRNGHVVYEYNLREPPSAHEQAIYDSISDICVSMKAKDWLELPECIIRDVKLKLPQQQWLNYLDFERKQVLRLTDDDEISAINAAALSNKLLQYANGAVYDEAKKYHEVHDVKLKALEEIVEASNGKPVLVFYSYQSDVDRILKHLKHLNPYKLGKSSDIKRWNNKEIPLLLCHPASAGHGLNMQAGGSTIVWFGLSWSLELYLQANARLDRQGQTESVIIHRLLVAGTLDEDVAISLTEKEDDQDSLMRAVKARIHKYSVGGSYDLAA